MDWTNTSQWDSRSNRPKVSDKVEVLELRNKWTTVRMIGRSVSHAVHWLNTIATPKKGKDGEKARGERRDGKKTINSFPKACRGVYFADDGSLQIDAKKCAYCSILEDTPRVEAFVNVISRDLQENEPRRKGKPTRYERKKQKLAAGVAFYKEDKETEAWTPVRIVRVTPSLGKKISEIASLNTRKTEEGKKAFGPEHPKFGFDLMLKFNKDAASPNDMYSAQKGEMTKLTQEEAELLRWNVETGSTETDAEAQKEAKRIKPYLCNREGQLSFPELAEADKKRGKGDHSKYRDQFDDDDDDAEDDDDDDDDRRSKSKKAKDKKRSRSRDDDDSDDDDFDEGIDDDDDSDDDEDEEDDRRSRKKAVKKAKAKRRSRDDDDDDLDDDDDDSDDDDEDEDEEDDRRSRKRGSKDKKSSKSKRRSRDDDEDDDDDDDDSDDDGDDEDEEDDRRSNKGKKFSKSKLKSKRSSRDDDDDDDEIPF